RWRDHAGRRSAYSLPKTGKPVRGWLYRKPSDEFAPREGDKAGFRHGIQRDGRTERYFDPDSGSAGTFSGKIPGQNNRPWSASGTYHRRKQERDTCSSLL